MSGAQCLLEVLSLYCHFTGMLYFSLNEWLCYKVNLDFIIELFFIGGGGAHWEGFNEEASKGNK